MAYGLNKVMLIGNLGSDPELRYTQNGTPVTSFSLATNESYKGKDGNMVEKTEWHRIVAFQHIAETLAQYLKKGRKIYLEGKLQTRSWDDKDGSKKYMTEIVVDTFVFIDSRGNGSGSGEERQVQPPAEVEGPAATDEDLPF